MPSSPARILILGGTREGRELAARLHGDERFLPITSLAGVTRSREEIYGETRIGGFGGAAGIVEFIRSSRVDMVVDAAHPFAALISSNAAEACARLGVPYLRLERAPWQPEPDDDWTVVPGIPEAAVAIPNGARAFVTVGRKDIALFFARTDIRLVARMIEPPQAEPPVNTEILLARPPFTVEQETRLMRDKAVSVLVAKNSGGSATYAKIEAARALGLPVIMVARPGKPPLPCAASADEMLTRIERNMA